jgi:CheY-like chemotaxis protein
MPKAILVVDDSEDDVCILMRSVKAVGVTCPVHCVYTAEDAICYLKGEGQFSNRDIYPQATLVLLDVKLHDRSGLDVLEWIRSQRDLASMIIVVFTSNEDPRKVKPAYELGANSFLFKPFSNKARNEVVKTLHHYWLVMNRA